MKTTSIFQPNSFKATLQTMRKSAAIALRVAAIAAMPALSGCLLTSPFWNQQFSSHTTAIPMQSFTTSNASPVKFECSKAGHYGLYPYDGPATWVTVANVSPSTSASYDPLGNVIYSAGLKTALPASCWRQDPANSIWYTAIRASQTISGSTTQYKTFTKAGLECLGREIGKATSWFGWAGKNCTATYSGSTTEIPFVIVYSAS
ncbi:MAG: hypothetical protein NVV73_09800 [Cellvibrionaceae bacterium]|nr:hypothetical protein [Cellvibrionaceae bacterium]